MEIPTIDMFDTYKLFEFINLCTDVDLDKLVKEIELETRIRQFRKDKLDMLKKEMVERRDSMMRSIDIFKKEIDDYAKEKSEQSEDESIEKTPVKKHSKKVSPEVNKKYNVKNKKK